MTQPIQSIQSEILHQLSIDVLQIKKITKIKNSIKSDSKVNTKLKSKTKKKKKVITLEPSTAYPTIQKRSMDVTNTDTTTKTIMYLNQTSPTNENRKKISTSKCIQSILSQTAATSSHTKKIISPPKNTFCPNTYFDPVDSLSPTGNPDNSNNGSSSGNSSSSNNDYNKHNYDNNDMLSLLLKQQHTTETSKRSDEIILPTASSKRNSNWTNNYNPYPLYKNVLPSKNSEIITGLGLSEPINNLSINRLALLQKLFTHGIVHSYTN